MEEKTCQGCKFKTPDQIQGLNERWGTCRLLKKLNKKLKLDDVYLSAKSDRSTCCFSNVNNVKNMLESDYQFTAEDYGQYITDKCMKNKILYIKKEK